MALFPQGARGLGAALQEASPLLLGLAQGIRAQNPYGGLQQGLGAMMQQQEKRQADEMWQSLFGGGGNVSMSTSGAPQQGLAGAMSPVSSGQPMTYGASAPPGSTLGLLREFEGFRETPYWDVNALRTGYGSDTVTMADGRVVPVTEGTRVSREDAERDLARRVSTEFEPIAARAAGDQWNSLNGGQRAALTSIAYNYGRIPESVTRALRGGGDVQAAIRGLAGHNDGVNAGRREREAQIYGGGVTMSTQGQQGPSLDRLYAALGSGRLNGAQASVVQMMIQQQLAQQQQQQQMIAQQNDPLRQIQLQTAQAELEQLRNPQAQPTDRMQNYAFLRSQGVDESSALQQAFGNGGTTVNVGGDSAPSLGKLSPDFGYVLDPVTRQPVIDAVTGLPTAAPVPGSPAAIEAAQTQQQRGLQQEQTSRSANIVLDDIDRALGQIEDQGVLSPTTGFFGNMVSEVGGTAANDLRNTLLTVQGNIGFDRLQQMREASPTGGALGAISDRELATLQAVMGALAQNQSQEQLTSNLNRLKTLYTDITRKAAAYPNAGQFGFGGDQQRSAQGEQLFSGLNTQDLLAIDVMKLSPDQLDAYEQALKGLGQ